MLQTVPIACLALHFRLLKRPMNVVHGVQTDRIAVDDVQVIEQIDRIEGAGDGRRVAVGLAVKQRDLLVGHAHGDRRLAQTSQTRGLHQVVRVLLVVEPVDVLLVDERIGQEGQRGDQRVVVRLKLILDVEVVEILLDLDLRVDDVPVALESVARYGRANDGRRGERVTADETTEIVCFRGRIENVDARDIIGVVENAPANGRTRTDEQQMPMGIVGEDAHAQFSVIEREVQLNSTMEQQEGLIGRRPVQLMEV